ncbi:MAG TPA: hypothetical protein HPP56_06755, partial [Nitrospirae bacterium]|nr:hypothetical protein [Nitrospirota bacterium]
QRALSKLVNLDKADYAVFTGIQIHGPDGMNYVSPDICYAIIDKAKKDISLK